MWRTIYTQLLYQVLVMTVLLYAAPSMFGIKYQLVKNFSTSAEESYNQMMHYTFLF